MKSRPTPPLRSSGLTEPSGCIFSPLHFTHGVIPAGKAETPFLLSAGLLSHYPQLKQQNNPPGSHGSNLGLAALELFIYLPHETVSFLRGEVAFRSSFVPRDVAVIWQTSDAQRTSVETS